MVMTCETFHSIWLKIYYQHSIYLFYLCAARVNLATISFHLNHFILIPSTHLFNIHELNIVLLCTLNRCIIFIYTYIYMYIDKLHDPLSYTRICVCMFLYVLHVNAQFVCRRRRRAELIPLNGKKKTIKL